MEHTGGFLRCEKSSFRVFLQVQKMETQLEALSRLVPRLGPAAGPRLQAGWEGDNILEVSLRKACHWPEIWLWLKGTVARDFLVSVFFMDILYMGPRFRG
jgi:hypothetical protein